MNNLTATLNQIGQVCRLYWIVCTSSFAAFFVSVWVVLFGIGGMFVLQAGDQNYFGMSVVYPVAAITYFLKRQIVQIRERRLPGALWPHLFVWVMLLLLFTFAIPMVRIFLGVHIPLALFGIIAVMAAATVWALAVEVMWIGLAVIPLMYLQPRLLPASGFKEAFERFLQGKHEGLGMAMFACGIAGIAMAVLRLIRISEEDRGYFTKAFQKPADYSGQPAAGLIDREAQKAIWQSKWIRFYDLRSKSIPFWRIWARGTLNQRAKLWAIARGGNAAALMFPMIVLIVPFVLWLLSSSSDASKMINMVPMYAAFPLFVSMGQWEQQRSIWTIELLRPASRRQFFMEMGFTMFKQAATIWFAIAAAFTAEILAISPDAETFQKIAKLQILLAGSQFMFFGIVVELLRFRSRAVKILMPVILIPMFFLVFMNSGASSSIQWLTVAWIVLLMVVAGTALIYDAYRRWLRTELG